jgi:hypothetical protein
MPVTGAVPRPADRAGSFSGRRVGGSTPAVRRGGARRRPDRATSARTGGDPAPGSRCPRRATDAGDAGGGPRRCGRRRCGGDDEAAGGVVHRSILPGRLGRSARVVRPCPNPRAGESARHRPDDAWPVIQAVADGSASVPAGCRPGDAPRSWDVGRPAGIAAGRRGSRAGIPGARKSGAVVAPLAVVSRGPAVRPRG